VSARHHLTKALAGHLHPSTTQRYAHMVRNELRATILRRAARGHPSALPEGRAGADDGGRHRRGPKTSREHRAVRRPVRTDARTHGFGRRSAAAPVRRRRRDVPADDGDHGAQAVEPHRLRRDLPEAPHPRARADAARGHRPARDGHARRRHGEAGPLAEPTQERSDLHPLGAPRRAPITTASLTCRRSRRCRRRAARPSFRCAGSRSRPSSPCT
jgi:hypothetical protein